MFSEEQITEFQEIFLEEFEYEISDEEAFEYANKFLDLLLVTYKPNP